MSVLHVVSVSGGKDSEATYVWAIENLGPDGFRAVTADTDFEHPVTYNFTRNLPSLAGGPAIETVSASFEEKLRAKGIEPSGNRFLDMMLLKGRAPSSQAQFCTGLMKLEPIKAWLESVRGDHEVIMYVGIRAEESERRAKYPDREFSDFYDCWIVRPILRWTEMGVKNYLKARGIPINPLYDAGQARVGCYPCINSNKSALAAIEDWAWERLEQWEQRMGRTFFAPMVPGMEINWAKDVREWARTSRGGRQFNLFETKATETSSCMSGWVCE
jgi:3'-phosphoadenosine 5'-phosphosulfate sulfotransferase (PAPS reductase)/FAD synthetase